MRCATKERAATAVARDVRPHMPMEVLKGLGGLGAYVDSPSVEPVKVKLQHQWIPADEIFPVRNGQLTVYITCADETKSTLVLFRTTALLLIYFP